MKGVSQKELEEGYRKWKFHEKVENLYYSIILPQAKHEVPEEKRTYVERVELTNGMWTFYKGLSFPYAGCAETRIVQRIDEMKKNAMALFWGLKKILENRVMGFLFLLVFRKQIETMLEAFVQCLHENIVNVRARQERYCRCVKETRRAMVECDFSEKIVDIVCMTLEFDSAYRFRYQWAMERMDFTKEPLEELRKVLLEGEKRDHEENMKAKWRTARKFLIFVKFSKGMREKLKMFFQAIDKENVIMFLEDEYHADWRNVDAVFDYK